MTSVRMPQVILGHLPFLGESYQGELRNREYVGRFSKIENTIRILTRAVEEYGITVLGAAPASESQLADQLLEAVRVASQRTERKLSLIPCLRIPLTIDGVGVDDYRRRLSHYEVERKVNGKILGRYLDDPILQCREGWREKLLDASVNATPYSTEEIERVSIDYETVRSRLDSFQRFDVLFVEPGSETDFLAASGRLDLLNGLVEWIRETTSIYFLFLFFLTAGFGSSFFSSGLAASTGFASSFLSSGLGASVGGASVAFSPGADDGSDKLAHLQSTRS